MELIQTAPLQAYLAPATLVDRDTATIAAWVDEHLGGCSPEEAARRVFHFVRDEVSHSWDIRGTAVSRTASDALRIREGICYPKSHLIAALLRRAGIPTAICYQRLTLDDDDDSKGYAVHALNAVFIDGRWSRIDARGNKPGVDAQFSLDEERLAFPVRAQYGEVDYPELFAAPHRAIVHTLVSNDNALEMYAHGLPDALDGVL